MAGVLIIILAVINILFSIGLLMDVLLFSGWYAEGTVARILVYGLLTLIAAVIGIICAIQSILHRRFVLVLAGIVFMMVVGISIILVTVRVPPALFLNLGLTIPALILVLYSRKGFDELREDPPPALM